VIDDGEDNISGNVENRSESEKRRAVARRRRHDAANNKGISATVASSVRKYQGEKAARR